LQENKQTRRRKVEQGTRGTAGEVTKKKTKRTGAKSKKGESKEKSNAPRWAKRKAHTWAGRGRGGGVKEGNLKPKKGGRRKEGGNRGRGGQAPDPSENVIGKKAQYVMQELSPREVDTSIRTARL